jgi:uroporphyrinogen-III decarboxylase
MNHLERFRNVLHHKPVDRTPYWPTHGWSQTNQRWLEEGMPEGKSLEEIFDAEATLGVGVYYGPWPRIQEETLEQNGEKRIMRNHEGIIMQVYLHDTDKSMPHFLDFPVKTRDDYRKILKPRLTGPAEDRLPHDWNVRVAQWKNRTDPLNLFADRWGGFFGPLRNMMGLENLIYAFYDQPALVEEMMDDIADNMIRITDRILQDTDIDFFSFWEDMGMKTGPLLSPSLFKQYMVPRYRRVVDFLRSRGVDVIFVDSDGDVHDLIPHWLDAGINGIWPCEIAASMEPAPIQKEYGKDLLLFGGIDKRAIIESPEAIDEELKKVPPLVAAGGYVPMVDHSCPPDISWDNYCYYMEALRKAIQIA